jgi:hypothetical protein
VTRGRTENRREDRETRQRHEARGKVRNKGIFHEREQERQERPERQAKTERRERSERQRGQREV